jgi:hypothetical protein
MTKLTKYPQKDNQHIEPLIVSMLNLIAISLSNYESILTILRLELPLVESCSRRLSSSHQANFDPT